MNKVQLMGSLTPRDELQTTESLINHLKDNFPMLTDEMMSRITMKNLQKTMKTN